MEDRRAEVEAAAATLNSVLQAAGGVGLLPSNDRYYADRLSSGQLVSSYEIDLVAYIVRTLPESLTILEIGSGIGQLPLLLACLGRRAVGVEATPTRLGLAHRLQDALAALHRDAAARAVLVSGYYPEEVAFPHDLLLATNIVNSWWESWQIPDREKYQRTFVAPHAIIDLRTWFVLRETPEERHALASTIMQATGAQIAYEPIPGSTLVHLSRD